MRTEPVTAKGIETKARIIRATKAVYEKVGRDRLDTQLVADEAGVSIGTLYRYFEDRVDLLDHAVPNRDRELLDKFLGRLKDVERTNFQLDGIAVDEFYYAGDVDELVQEFTPGSTEADRSAL